MRRSPLLLLTLGLAVGALPPGAEAAPSEPASFQEALSGMGLVFDGGGSFRLESSRQWGSWPGPGSQWTAAASSGPARLRLQAYAGLDSKAAAAKVELQVFRIQFLFSGKMAYPDLVTRRFEVPAALTPGTVDRGPGKFQALLLPATADLAYGPGAEDIVVYRGVLAFLHCPGRRRLFQIEFFVPKAEYDRGRALRELDLFRCPGKR